MLTRLDLSFVFCRFVCEQIVFVRLWSPVSHPGGAVGQFSAVQCSAVQRDQEEQCSVADRQFSGPCESSKWHSAVSTPLHLTAGDWVCPYCNVPPRCTELELAAALCGIC
jgi:hypothetical protein